MVTGNRQLEYWMRKRKDFVGVFAKDQLMSALQKCRHTKSSTLIVNTDTINLPGVHWLALYLLPNDRVVKYFDPYAWIPDSAICRQLLQSGYNNIYHYPFASQNLMQSNCGEHCVYFLYNLTPASSDFSAMLFINKYLK